jgi:RNA polymerase sigma-70 factor (ECF subfamily)
MSVDAKALVGLGRGRAEEVSPLEAEVVELFDQLRDRLLRYVLTFGLAAADCEEVVQESFLALFRHLQLGRSRENLPGWLFRVGHNLALKKRRRYKWQSTEKPDLLMADPGPGPDRLFATNQTQSRLLSVVQALPERDRRCLELRVEGFRYRDIAEMLGMSLGAVSMSLARSLGRIARAAER